MAKNILIFSDGTGQYGGQKPDQKLSNIYKMYRAMRPGPRSPISYDKQVAYYDPGLGAGEVGGIFSSFGRIKNMFEASVGAGIDNNVIDCYEKILAYYEPEDRIMLFGFSRGAYTVRALANVMNLCGVPTRLPEGGLLPKDGPVLRAIAREAVKTVYGHGAGKPRTHEQYYPEREEKGRRFRAKYGSAPPEGEEDVQGNIQPHFIGIFDTVAALGNKIIATIFAAIVILLSLATTFSDQLGLGGWLAAALGVALVVSVVWFIKVLVGQIRYFEPNPEKPLRIWRPGDWGKILHHTHLASWNKKNYDMWLDRDVGFARHALAIDENRKNFPRVPWGHSREVIANSHKTNPLWLDQVWFAGCHSDIGGSYDERESRLSDVAMDWMMKELNACFPMVRVNESSLYMSPNPRGLQHFEDTFLNLWLFTIPWPRKPREVRNDFKLHPTVIERLAEDNVPQPGKMAPYRPEAIKDHPQAKPYYD